MYLEVSTQGSAPTRHWMTPCHVHTSSRCRTGQLATWQVCRNWDRVDSGRLWVDSGRTKGKPLRFFHYACACMRARGLQNRGERRLLGSRVASLPVQTGKSAVSPHFGRLFLHFDQTSSPEGLVHACARSYMRSVAPFACALLERDVVIQMYSYVGCGPACRSCLTWL